MKSRLSIREDVAPRLTEQLCEEDNKSQSDNSLGGLETSGELSL